MVIEILKEKFKLVCWKKLSLSIHKSFFIRMIHNFRLPKYQKRKIFNLKCPVTFYKLITVDGELDGKNQAKSCGKVDSLTLQQLGFVYSLANQYIRTRN